MSWHYSQITNQWMAAGEGDRLWKVTEVHGRYVLTESFDVPGDVPGLEFGTASQAMIYANLREQQLVESIHA